MQIKSNAMNTLFAVCLLGIFSLITGSALAATNKLWDPGTFQNLPDYSPSCSDCYVQEVEIDVPPTGVVVGTTSPSCGNSAVVQFWDMASAALSSYISGDMSGSTLEMAKSYASTQLRNQVGGDLQGALDANGPRTPNGLCAPLSATIPKAADVVEVHLGDWDDNVGVGACDPNGSDCANGWARFMITPAISTATNGGQVISTLFINWSHDRMRVARMFVAYRMPAGKKPITFK